MQEFSRSLILCLGSGDVSSLETRVNNILNILNQDKTDVLGSIKKEHSLNTPNAAARLGITGKNKEEIIKKLQSWNSNKAAIEVDYTDAAPHDLKLAFLFTGQGAQTAGMGKVLYDNNSIFRESLDKCANILSDAPNFDLDLLSVIWGDNKSKINETRYTQPALFAFEYALYTLFQSMGVQPKSVLGHSVGEYVAATVAGVLSLEDGLRVIAERARLMQQLPSNGAMLMIPSSKKEVETVVNRYSGKVSIAAFNAPKSIVISGETDAVNDIAEVFSDSDIEAIPLVVSHAFHSHLLEPMLGGLENAFAEIDINDPQIELISNLTGMPIEEKEMQDKEYWTKHTRNTVQFAPSIEYLLNNDFRNFVEIGPHPVLTGLGQQCIIQWSSKNNPADPKPIILSIMDRNKDNWETLNNCLSKLFVRGVDLDLSKISE